MFDSHKLTAKKKQKLNKTMKNRSIILTAILSLLGSGGLSSTALAAGAAPVTVTNTATNPVPIIGTVAAADNPARSAVQLTVNLDVAQNGDFSEVPTFVPAGKIFVVEYVSFYAKTPGDTVEYVSIKVAEPHLDGSSGLSEYFLAMPPRTPFGLTIGSQVVRLYAPPGQPIYATVLLTTPNQTSDNYPVQASLSGYLVNAR
jgi:hypothetical protein